MLAELRVERVALGRLTMHCVALLQRRVGLVEQAPEVPQAGALGQAVLMATAARAALTHPALLRVRVVVDFWEQVEIVLVLLPLEQEVAVLVVRAALHFQAQLFQLAAQAAHRVVVQAQLAVLMAQEVLAAAPVGGWAGALRVAELSCLVLLLDLAVL